MKRCFCLILSFFLVLSAFGGCAASGNPTTAPTTVPPESTYVSDPLEALRNKLPVMDGSTSLIPLEAGIRAALFGISMEEATGQVAHTTSWDSFYNLVHGYSELIFSVPLSPEQYAYASEQGVVLEEVPIAKEGFVFVVNAHNPVDALTQDQIRDIYSGKITNWAQVGGLDEPIIPYQRNTDSGSQNYMRSFMRDIPLLDAPVEYRPTSMSGLMDVIAVNDNSRAAIGYSVYAYAADMYGNGDEIKFLQVDGVAPSRQTFADGSYPLTGCNYAIFRAEEPEDSSVRKLVSWMLTPEGQTAIAQAGYVTVLDVGFDYGEKTHDKYSGIGTGAPAAVPSPDEYIIRDVQYTQGGSPFFTNSLVPEVGFTQLDGQTVRTWKISKLADKTLQEEINAWIVRQMLWAKEERPALDALIEQLNLHDQTNLYQYYRTEDMDADCFVSLRNGYLSVTVTMSYFSSSAMTTTKYYRTECATWDLLTGKQLSVEDLFCQGVDIDAVLNPYIRERSQTTRQEYGAIPETARDFTSLTAEGWHITPDAIYFDYGNDCFSYGERIALDELPDGTLVTELPRDFSDLLDPESGAVAVRTMRYVTRDTVYGYNADGFATCALLREEAHPNAAKINGEILNYLNTHFTEDAIRSWFEAQGYGYDCPIDTGMGSLDWKMINYGGKYLLFYGNTPVTYRDDRVIRYPLETRFLYSLETGEQIPWTELVLPGWESVAQWRDNTLPADPRNGDLSYVSFGSEGLTISLIEEGVTYDVTIPQSHIRF